MWPYTGEEKGWLASGQQWAAQQHAVPVQQSLPFPEAWAYAAEDNAPRDPMIMVCK